MEGHPPWYKDEKQLVAVSSVAAAIFLTSFKLYAGITTNSLGILSEFLHSALDLIAACITVWAVHSAAHPADEQHPYGHGKVESFSALTETMLLLITCAWIMWEAVMRIIGEPHVEPSLIGFVVMSVAIIIDVSRWKALSKVARKYESQALEADALHFSSDVLSSSVVIAGLIFVRLGHPIGDPLAAVGVALVVLFLCYRMGRKTYDSLIDARIPKEEERVIMEVLRSHRKDFAEFHEFRTRQAGAERHIDLHLVVNKDAHVGQAHDLCETIEREIKARLKNTQVLIHIEPCDENCDLCARRQLCK